MWREDQTKIGIKVGGHQLLEEFKEFSYLGTKLQKMEDVPGK